MLSLLTRLFAPAAAVEQPVIREMPQADIDTIREFALGDESKRLAAIQAHRRNLGGSATNSIYMRFMSEVDTPVPDLILRHTYRHRIRQSALA